LAYILRSGNVSISMSNRPRAQAMWARQAIKYIAKIFLLKTFQAIRDCSNATRLRYIEGFMMHSISSKPRPSERHPAPTHAAVALPHPVDALLQAHGLRRTAIARRVLGWLLAHADTSFTHAQLLAALADDSARTELPLDRVTLYRLIDRLTQVGLLLCRVDANRLRRYQAMPASVRALPHFECQACHRDRPLDATQELEQAARAAMEALSAVGYRGLSFDLAVRGLCADCASGAGGAGGTAGASA
jgi:Fur family transcriptional regulator, ferric uptake regulator